MEGKKEEARSGVRIGRMRDGRWMGRGKTRGLRLELGFYCCDD